MPLGKEAQSFYKEITKIRFMPSIIGLPEMLKNLNKKNKDLFNRFFSVQRSTGRLVLPESMKKWAENTFGHQNHVEEQVIVKILDKLVFEEALYNELRAKRPIQAKENEDFEKIIKQSAGGPFSKPLQLTPEDMFGRIKGKHCVTASNVAKYDGMHGLVVFKKHNPLDFNQEDLYDYFDTALKWFEKAHKTNEKAIYPFLLWNCLWRSGASIIHGHIQMVLGEGFHYGDVEKENKVRLEYHKKYKSDYFKDFFRIHKQIGLGFEEEGQQIFMNIVPREDKEVTIIAKKLDRNCVRAIYKIAKCLTDDFGVVSFNLGVVFPPLKKMQNWKDFPVIVRIVDRGKLSSKTTDIGGMEIYDMGNVISTDPYKVFEKIKKSFA